MPLAARATRVARRTVDVLLIGLIASVVMMLVLARGIPLVTGGSTFVVGGGSMAPAIPVGAVVHAAPVDPSALAPGDVVSIKAGPRQAVFTHRIVRLAELPDGLYLQTRGDANGAPDPALIPVTDVIGRVELAIPYAGFGVALVSSTLGILFLLCFAAVLLVGAWLLEGVEGDQLEAANRRTGPAAGAMSPETGAEAGAA